MQKLSDDEIRTILRNVLKGAKYEVKNCTQGDNSDLSIGFLSFPNCVRLTYECEGATNSMHLFLKRLPDEGYHRELIIAVNAFERESVIYENFLNHFQDYFEGSPFPKCYLNSNELIVLEDLSRIGFRTPSGSIFTKEESEKAVDAVAMLHASSLIYEKMNNKKILDIIPELAKPSVISLEVEVSKNFFFSSVDALKAVADKYDCSYPLEVRDRAFKFMQRMPGSLGPSSAYPNVLSHADLWRNNVMFRYGDMGKVVECRLVDFQFSSYTSPSFDLLLLLDNCAPPADRPGLQRRYARVLGGLLAARGLEPLDDRVFADMLSDAEPLLLAVSAVCVHFTELPAQLLPPILADPAAHRAFIEGDRSQAVLQGIALSSDYRHRVIASLSELFEYFKNH